MLIHRKSGRSYRKKVDFGLGIYTVIVSAFVTLVWVVVLKENFIFPHFNVLLGCIGMCFAGIAYWRAVISFGSIFATHTASIYPTHITHTWGMRVVKFSNDGRGRSYLLWGKVLYVKAGSWTGVWISGNKVNALLPILDANGYPVVKVSNLTQVLILLSYVGVAFAVHRLLNIFPELTFLGIILVCITTFMCAYFKKGARFRKINWFRLSKLNPHFEALVFSVLAFSLLHFSDVPLSDADRKYSELADRFISKPDRSAVDKMENMTLKDSSKRHKNFISCAHLVLFVNENNIKIKNPHVAREIQTYSAAHCPPMRAPASE